MTDQNSAPTNDAPVIAADARPAPGAVPYSRFKAVVDSTRALQAQVDDLTAQAAKADDLKAQIAGLELQMYQQEVARDYGLPPEYLPYIAGASKQEIATKAAGLVAAIPGLGKVAPPAFAPGQVRDKSWYARNRSHVLHTLGLDS